MKKQLLFLLFALFFGVTNVWAADRDVFTAPVQVVKDGVTSTEIMQFRVIDEQDRTCMVASTYDDDTDIYSPAINNRIEGKLIVPEIVNGYTVTKLAAESFVDCHFSEIELPNTISNIYYGAFDRCTLLQEIYLPNNVTELEMLPLRVRLKPQ